MRVSSALAALVSVWASTAVAEAQCRIAGPYDPHEIATSTFFSTREQTKFAPHERHYPLPTGASARYCFSRGCTGQLDVTWSEEEQNTLRRIRASMLDADTPAAELRFIKVAVLQMETWLYERLRSLDQRTVGRLMKQTAGNYSRSLPESMSWMTEAMGSNDRFDKECATYAMEATQHLLVLANVGLMQHWSVLPPVYRYGIPGHWTAGLENRTTCETWRFDLNTQASSRNRLHTVGRNPAALAMEDPGRHGHLFPGMDRISGAVARSRSKDAGWESERAGVGLRGR